MGRCVSLWKKKESEKNVIYEYGPCSDKKETGELLFSKKDGTIKILRLFPNYNLEENVFLFFLNIGKFRKNQMIFQS